MNAPTDSLHRLVGRFLVLTCRHKAFIRIEFVGTSNAGPSVYGGAMIFGHEKRKCTRCGQVSVRLTWIAYDDNGEERAHAS